MVKAVYSIAVNGTPSQSYGVSLAIWDHTVLPDTRHKSAHPASTPGRYSIYLPRWDGRLSWPRWLVTYGDGLPARRRSVTQPRTTGPIVD